MKSIFLFMMISSVTLLAGEDKLVRQGADFRTHEGSILWNSVGVGIDHVYVNFKDSESHIKPLNAIYFNDGVNGYFASFTGFNTFTIINQGELTLNTDDGYVYLGDERVGVWHGHPSHQAENNGFGISFRAAVEINEVNRTILIYDGKEPF